MYLWSITHNLIVSFVNRLDPLREVSLSDGEEPSPWITMKRFELLWACAIDRPLLDNKVSYSSICYIQILLESKSSSVRLSLFSWNEWTRWTILSLSLTYFHFPTKIGRCLVLIQHNEEQRELIRHVTEVISVYFYHSHAAT